MSRLTVALVGARLLDLKPTSVSVIQLVLGLTVFYIVQSYVRAYWRLRHIPGPRIAAWSNVWYIRNAVSGELHKRQSAVCERYGSVVRIGPNTLVTTDEDLIRAMNGVRTEFGKSSWYKAFRFDASKDNLVSVLDDDLHTTMRSKLAPGYGGKDNPQLEQDIDDVVLSMVNLIRRKYLSKGNDVRPFDWALKAQYLVLDVISKLALGESFGWVLDDEDKFDYISTWTANIPTVSFLSSVPWIARLMTHPSVQPYLVPSVKERAGLGAIKAAARERIALRFGDNKESGRQDMVQSFINHGLTKNEVADESLLQIVAGSDTTASTIRTAFLYILSHPTVYRKLQAECDAACIPATQVIPDSTASNLPYLSACLRETFRIRTPIAGMLPRIVPRQGYTTTSGLYIPGGTEIGMSMWNVQYNTAVFGSDVHSFRPERWLEASPTQLAAMQKSNDLNFGYGKYRCLGERIAMLELTKVVFEMFRRFEWSFIDARVPVEWERNYGLWYMRGMWLRVEERDTHG